MCCSVSPGVEVRFSDTVLYAAEVIGPAGDPVHVLGYQNKVQGSVGLLARLRRWVYPGRPGNAMILPFPAVTGTMTRANVLDTSECRDVLQDMASAVAPPRAFPRADRWAKATMLLADVEVFSTGIYTVVLARDARFIPSALDEVPPAKRPALNPALFDAYARWYPGWTVALCCFDNRDAKLADPLLWWYRPMDPDRLFLPALDGHTGAVPDLDSRPMVDHVVAVGSHRLKVGNHVHYRDELPSAVKPYLVPEVIGSRISETMPNGDFICRLDDVHGGRFTPARTSPPGA